jgi:hypothetical protein
MINLLYEVNPVDAPCGRAMGWLLEKGSSLRHHPLSLRPIWIGSAFAASVLQRLT